MLTKANVTTAKALRQAGIPIPEIIPDEATIPLNGIKRGDFCLDVVPEDTKSISCNVSVTFTEPFTWKVDQVNS